MYTGNLPDMSVHSVVSYIQLLDRSHGRVSPRHGTSTAYPLPSPLDMGPGYPTPSSWTWILYPWIWARLPYPTPTITGDFFKIIHMRTTRSIYNYQWRMDSTTQFILLCSVSNKNLSFKDCIVVLLTSGNKLLCLFMQITFHNESSFMQYLH